MSINLLGDSKDSKSNITKTVLDMDEVLGSGYNEFWTHKGRYRLVKGGRGSKKSTTAALWYIYHMMYYWYKYGIQVEMLCLRAYFVNHFDSTYSQLRWAIKHLQVGHLWKCYRNPLYIKFLPSGGRIVFKGLDSPDKITSIKSPTGHFAWVWLEEAFEVKSSQAFEKINLSIRGNLPKPLYYQMTLTFNPYSEKHWLKARYFDKVDERTGLSSDGEVLAITRNYDCNEFLDPAFLKEMERLRLEHPHEFSVVGLGQWGIQLGVIYKGYYSIRTFVGDAGTNRLMDIIQTLSSAGFTLRCGLDFGFTNHPSAFVITMVNVESRELYILDEVVGFGMTHLAIVAAIKSKGAIFASCPIIADSASPMAISLIKREGIHGIKKSIKGGGSVLAGIDHVKTFKIVVSPMCVNTIVELENYKWVTSRDNDEEFLNEPMDEFNHCLDALRYAVEDVRPDFFANKNRHGERGLDRKKLSFY